MFENKTFESIKQSIIDKLTGTAATIEGSYTGRHHRRSGA